MSVAANLSEAVRPVTARRQGYDLLRIVSICGVVAIHTFGASNANTELRGSVHWWVALVLSAGAVWAVPVFVMLSGALTLTERAHADGPARFYARRAKRIIPAIIAWNLIYLVIIRMLVLRQHLSGHTIVEQLVDATVYPQLYFLWLIAGLYLIAPVLAAFLHQGGRSRAIILAASTLAFTLVVFMQPGVLGAVGISRPIQLGTLTVWVAYVGFFLAGYALSHITATRAWIVVCAIGIVVAGTVAILQAGFATRLSLLNAIARPDYEGPIVAVLSICVFVAAVPLFDRIRFGDRALRFVRTLSEACFGVFLVHLIVLLGPYWLFPGFHDQTSLLATVGAYLIILVVSFGISIGARKIPGLRLIF